MNFKAIVASLVLGSSSAAVAAPAVVFQARGSVSVGASYSTSPTVRDHRTVVTTTRSRDHRRYEPAPVYGQPVYGRPVYGQPVDFCDNISGSYYRGPVGQMPRSGHANVALTAPTRIENGHQIITVGDTKGLFTQLTLRANTGATFIRDIEIEMGKGDVQVVHVNRWLDGRSSAFTFDVDGRRGRVITQITVNGESNFGSRYSITSER
jgi:hypothetical protein